MLLAAMTVSAGHAERRRHQCDISTGAVMT
jgi:hypothetical protein